MKVPVKRLMKAAAKKRAREERSGGQQVPAPKRPTMPAHEPPVPQEPPIGPEIDLTADTPPERVVVEEGAPIELVAEEPMTAEEPLAAEEPAVPDEPVPDAPARDWGEGPSGAANSPPVPVTMRSPSHAESGTAEAAEGGGVRRRPPRDSVLNDGRWAERLISSIFVPEVQEELSHLKAATFFRESYAALVRLANSLAATREAIQGGKSLIREAQEEAEEARARAERAEEKANKAEEALGSAMTARADEIRAAEDRAEMEARRLRAALSQMMEAENAIAARDLHITELESALQGAETQAREAEEKANKAEEDLSRALEAERAAAASLAAEKESRAAEVGAAVEAGTARIIENFKASRQFADELAEASAEAYLQGFQHGKEKVARDLDFPQALEVEPERMSEVSSSDDEPAPGET